MANKRNEDMEGSERYEEKDPFLTKTNSFRPRQDLGTAHYLSKIDNSRPASIMAYCLSSISMTVVNKYVVSGSSWNLNFFYLAIQVCTAHPIPCRLPRSFCD
jgi:GDP-mannose transporter